MMKSKSDRLVEKEYSSPEKKQRTSIFSFINWISSETNINKKNNKNDDDSSTNETHSSPTIMNDDQSIRSSSPVVFDSPISNKRTSLLSCFHCSRASPRSDGFFQRILNFKARKRQTSTRKQHLASTIPNGYLTVDDPQPHHDHDPETSFFPPPSPYQHYHRSSIDYFTSPLQTSDSVSSLHRYSYRHRLNEHFDAYSFNDIEMSSSTTTATSGSISQIRYPRKRALHRSSSKSVLSQNLSSGTTDLSAYSTQSLLRKLLDKAQVLDYHYNQIWKKTSDQSSSLSLQSNSVNPRSHSFVARPMDSKKKSPSRRERTFVGNLSSNSSRNDLYQDEDHVLRELIRFNNDIDLILTRLEMEGENPPSTTINDQQIQTDDLHSSTTEEIFTMKVNTNEMNIHLLRANDLDRIRRAALAQLLKMAREYCDPDQIEEYQTITLNKLNKLPKSTTWKGKNVFAVPLRVYQQMTGEVLPQAISQALQYVRLHAGKCDGLFRKPGVKSKIDRLRSQIETHQTIEFDEYQPFVVADVIRQYFRELPDGLISPLLTRFLADLSKYLMQEEQMFAIRSIFLLLPDENREVLESLLRFLLDVSIRSGNSQTVCRSLARIFLPSVFQSYFELRPMSKKLLWWKRKKEKIDAIEQENERLNLEHCLMLMIVNVDLLCRVPTELNENFDLAATKKSQKLDELVRSVCQGEFHLKKYMSKDSEQFLQRLATLKFKTVSTHFEGVQLAICKSSSSPSEDLPIWKCSIEIPQIDVKSVCQRILHERYLWDQHFAECRVVEKIDDDKEIVQYVLNFLDSVPVRSFCEFRFLKKISSHSTSDGPSMLISAISIDHLQNHFLPGSIGLTLEMHYYIRPSRTHPDSTTVTQIASVDFSGRSTYWYEHVYGSLLAQNISRLRETFHRPAQPTRV